MSTAGSFSSRTLHADRIRGRGKPSFLGLRHDQLGAAVTRAPMATAPRVSLHRSAFHRMVTDAAGNRELDRKNPVLPAAEPGPDPVRRRPARRAAARSPVRSPDSGERALRTYPSAPVVSANNRHGTIPVTLRLLPALLVGAALAAAGACYQTLFRLAARGTGACNGHPCHCAHGRGAFVRLRSRRPGRGARGWPHGLRAVACASRRQPSHHATRAGEILIGYLARRAVTLVPCYPLPKGHARARDSLRNFPCLDGLVQIVSGLQVHPQLGGCPKDIGEIKRGARRYASLAPDEFVETSLCPANSVRKFRLAHPHGLQKLFKKHLSGMKGIRWLIVHGSRPRQ